MRYYLLTLLMIALIFNSNSTLQANEIIAPQGVTLASSDAGLSSNGVLPDEESLKKFFQSSPDTNSDYLSSAIADKCCKICRKGKACGNSCISKSYTCRQPPGCACNGD